MNANYLILFLAALIMTPALSLQAQEQETAAGNSRFVMTLQDSYVQRLKSSGSLESPVRKDAQGRISAVQIQFSGSAAQAAVVVDNKVAVSGNACQIQLDDATIDMARNQPIRINIPAGSVFSKVFLFYQAPATNSNELDNDASTNNNAMPQTNLGSSPISEFTYRHYVKLSDDTTASGQMDLDQELKFQTKFGEVKISMGQIAGIRFHIDGEDAAMVVLRNGDSITGTLANDSFEMKTDWGRAEFDPIFVEAITTSQNARFQQTNDPGFGSRWQLIGR